MPSQRKRRSSSNSGNSSGNSSPAQYLNDLERNRKMPGASHAQAVNQDNRTTAANDQLFQLPDNRPRAAQLQSLQNAIQFSNRNGRRRKFVRGRKKEEQAAQEGSDLRVANFGDNWEVLEISDYMKRHQLQMRRMNRSVGKSVMHLSDGSIILIDSNQYWRHESAEQENAYYDASHALSNDNTRTHFWTRKGYARYKLSLAP